jgi:hypothetical protein
VTGAPAHDAAAPAGPAADNSWPTLARTLLADLVGVLRERLHLVALESQQFVQAAGRLLAFGVVAAVLVLTTWFVVIGAVVALLVHLGLPLAAALFVGGCLNLAGAFVAWTGMRRQLSLMAFPATLRALQVTATPRRTPAPTGSTTGQVETTDALESGAAGEGTSDPMLRATSP